MRIGIFGAVCFDEISLVGGEHRQSFGGITYNVGALSSVLNDGDTALPVTNIGEDRHGAALGLFNSLPHVDTSGIRRVPGKGVHVVLEWKSASWRDESVKHLMPPFTPEDLDIALNCDAVHVNFINGTEIDLATMKGFKEHFNGLLSLDIHNIISHFDEAGRRSIVGFPSWREWVPLFDVIQGNEFEFGVMFDKQLETRTDYVAAAKTVCEAGPRAVSATLGPEGAIMVHRKDDCYYLVDIDVLPPVEAKDATGCGDSYSAGFLVGMLRYDDPATAIACASIVAGVNARYSGIGNLPEAKDLLTDPRTHFNVFNARPPNWPGDPA